MNADRRLGALFVKFACDTKMIIPGAPQALVDASRKIGEALEADAEGYLGELSTKELREAGDACLQLSTFPQLRQNFTDYAMVCALRSLEPPQTTINDEDVRNLGFKV